MKIWLLQTGEPLPIKSGIRKMRTALLTEKLLERGHTVFWWGSAFEHQRKIWISKKYRNFNFGPKFNIRLLCGCGYRKNVSFSRYIDHRIVAQKFRHQSRRLESPDIVVTSMPCHHLAYEAVCYARARKIPVLVDVRDLWPDIFLSPLKNRLLEKISTFALSTDFTRSRTLLEKADALVAVSNGYLQWALNKAGRPVAQWDHVFYLGYKARQQGSAVCGNGNIETSDWLKGRENQKLLIFIGSFGVSYELKLLLQAARKIQAAGRTDFCLIIAGTGEQAEAINREAAGLSNVVLPGWIGAEEIGMLLAKGYIGLAPYCVLENTFPNKIFEYLSAGLPLISSLEGEMADLIEKYRLGLNYQAGDLSGLSRCIEKLLDNPDLREDMSSNGLKFFREYGDADKIYADYADHIVSLAEVRQHNNSNSKPYFKG
jgi:glycosyltransferase involved in cell wall biosynthesis